MGKDIDVTTTEEITVVVYCYECDSELEIKQTSFYDGGNLELVVKPYKCLTVEKK